MRPDKNNHSVYILLLIALLAGCKSGDRNVESKVPPVSEDYFQEIGQAIFLKNPDICLLKKSSYLS